MSTQFLARQFDWATPDWVLLGTDPTPNYMAGGPVATVADYVEPYNTNVAKQTLQLQTLVTTNSVIVNKS